MTNNKVVKSVSFNKKNQDEKRILDAVRRRNFSKYVKKLLLEDINKKQSNQTLPQSEPTQSQPTKQHLPPSPPFNGESRPLSPADQLSMLKRKG